MKIIKPYEEFELIIKDVCETSKSEPKQQKGGFLSMLFGKLGASLLWNL